MRASAGGRERVRAGRARARSGRGGWSRTAPPSPRAVCASGDAITPALFTRTCSGPFQASAERGDRPAIGEVEIAHVDVGVARRRGDVAAVCSPASRLRTASVTVAPAPASARAVSTPMPDAAPVTMTRRPLRSMPADDVRRGRLTPEFGGDEWHGNLRVDLVAEASSATPAHYRRHPPFYKEVLAGLPRPGSRSARCGSRRGRARSRCAVVPTEIRRALGLHALLVERTRASRRGRRRGSRCGRSPCRSRTARCDRGCT